jgi:hypothetical protein
MVNRVFIYGEFQGADPAALMLRRLLGGQQSDLATLATQAIEILREFSPLELIGKVYVLTQNRNYQPVSPMALRDYTWYKDYQKSSLGGATAKFHFKVKDGDLWQVLWIRQESDDSGPYIAVALRHE